MDHINKSIETLLEQLRFHEAKATQIKTGINALRGAIDLPPMFASTEPTVEVVNTGKFKCDQFYGQPLSTVVRTILEARKANNLSAASVEEIYEALVQGGYKFDISEEAGAKRGLKISLSKNTQSFHRLPSGLYGLKEWYPNASTKEQKTKPPVEAVEPVPLDEGSDVFDFDGKEKEAATGAA